MLKHALILAVVLAALVTAGSRHGQNRTGDPLPFCPPICSH